MKMETETISIQSFFLIFFRFAEGKSDKEILDHLLKNARYDKRLLPPVDGKLKSIFLRCFFPLLPIFLYMRADILACHIRR